MSARDVIARVKLQIQTNGSALGETAQIECWLGKEAADTILATLGAAWYAVVPRDPTADMILEGNLVIARNRLFATEIYKAMLAAANSAALRAAAGSATPEVK